MSMRIVLDRKLPFYSNEDWLSGRVEVDFAFPTQISYITVKLEGVSKSHITAPKHPDRPDKKKTFTELHKLLYMIENVLPPNPQPNAPWMLYGTHVYPFRFQFPMENDCLRNLSKQGIGFGDIFDGKNMHNATISHVTSLLPPSFDDHPLDGSIYYFLKATAVRPQFYKENYRAGVRLNFLPVPAETPQADSHAEVFARREHRFTTALSSRSSDVKGIEAPHFSAEIRLPNPPILTARGHLPLRIIVNNFNESRFCLFLDSIEIDLLTLTEFKSHHLRHKEARSSVLLTLSNMRMQILGSATPVNTMTIVDSSLWDRISLPEKLPSTFRTCNLSQTYDLEARLGFKYGYPDDVRPEMMILTLRHPVKVYANIQSISDRTLPPPQPPRRPQSGPYDDLPPSYEDAISQGPAPAASSSMLASTSELALAPAPSVGSPVSAATPEPVPAPAPAPASASTSKPGPVAHNEKADPSRDAADTITTVTATSTSLPVPSASVTASAPQPTDRSPSPLISLDDWPGSDDQHHQEQQHVDPEAHQIEQDRMLAQRLQDLEIGNDRNDESTNHRHSSNTNNGGRISGETAPSLPPRNKQDQDVWWG